MKAFPARLPQQPIFYPVLQLEYARQIASDWNAKSGQSAGYVTQFKVEDEYIGRFEKHTVGGSQHQEFWIPTEEVDEINKHIVGHIKVLEAYFGNAFEGFVPDQFGLQGKNAVDQFTLLANSYVYKRMDFYLEIKRNHKAVFLNYPFWQTHEFKNPGLKEKIIKAIREAWLTSFPKTPLVDPIEENNKFEKEIDADSTRNAPPEDIPPIEQSTSKTPGKPVDKKVTPIKPTFSNALAKPVGENIPLPKQRDSHPSVKPIQREGKPAEQADPQSALKAVPEDIPPTKVPVAQPLINRVKEVSTPLVSHFSQGIEFGLSGKYHEAIEELSRVVVQDPQNVVAQTSLGVAFHRMEEDDRALSCYEAALRTNPKYAEAHYFRANILYDQGDVREAITGYTLALGLQPDLIDAHQTRIPQDRLTDYTEAPAEIYRIAKPAHRILDLNKLLEINPRQANLLKERAAQYDRLRNNEQAIADYSSALAIQADDASALHLRGLAFEQIGQFDRALQDYQRAIAINPNLSSVYINRGVTLGKMGNFRQSVASLTEGIRLAPQNSDGYFNRGTSYFQLGDLNSAIEDFSNVIRLSPQDEDAYYWRGVSHEEAGHQQEAISDYRRFLEISQNVQAIAEVEERLSQWNQAEQKTASSSHAVRDDLPGTNQETDLYDLLVVLGERALSSTWLGSGVNCQGENSAALYEFTDHNRAIQGRDLLDIASGIRLTTEGDFTAFDSDAESYWILIRAWHGSGFYIEIDDSEGKDLLKANFESAEDVRAAHPPYDGLFIAR
jgi:tetratricopeptide (TPR) repeat protein